MPNVAVSDTSSPTNRGSSPVSWARNDRLPSTTRDAPRPLATSNESDFESNHATPSRRSTPLNDTAVPPVVSLPVNEPVADTVAVRSPSPRVWTNCPGSSKDAASVAGSSRPSKVPASAGRAYRNVNCRVNIAEAFPRPSNA